MSTKEECDRTGAVIVDGMAVVMTRDVYAASIGYSPDGKPFTVTARFDQGEWWRTKDGRWLRIADMDETHRYNTAAMLTRRAAHHAFAYSWAFVGVVGGHDGGDMAHDALEQISDELNRQAVDDPEGWLCGTTLYRALTAGLPTKPKKLKTLAERARHWSACPKRRDLKAPTCTCPKPVCQDSSCGCSGEAHA
jgi:hypothetical protein